MSELRTEAAELLDVLLERLTATRHTLDVTPSAAAEPADAPTAGEEPVTERSGLADAVCPTCGHDSAATGESAGERPSCTGCPLCALLAMLRGERPELTAKLVDGALTSLQAIRGLLGDLPATAQPDPASASAPAGAVADPIVTAASTEQPRPTERIRIR